MSIEPALGLEKSDLQMKDKFTEFLEKNYGDIDGEFPDNDRVDASLSIAFEEVEVFDSDLYEELLANPIPGMKSAEEALHELYSDHGSLSSAPVRPKDPPFPTTPIRELRAQDVNKFVLIEGIASKTSDVIPKIGRASFICGNGHRTEIDQPPKNELEFPEYCSVEGCEDTNFDVETTRSKLVDFQRIELQEPPEDLRGGETPQTIDVNLEGDVTGLVKPGDRLQVIGTLRSTREEAVLDTFVKGHTLELEDAEFEDLEITEEEVEKIEEIASLPLEELRQKFINSVAPSIYGYEDEKLAIAMQLFGGVRKQLEDGASIRGDFHMLLVGDPSTGKSQLVSYVKNLAPRAVYTSGKGSSSAGLTAAAVKSSDFGDEDNWTLEAGAMVLADKGIAAVDELDKMDSSDRSALHEAMEQQTVSVSKAGINATLKSRCSLLGAANPKNGRWDPHEAIVEQIELEPALMSRFDLIFIFEDKINEETDRDIAQHILNTNQVAQANVSSSEKLSEYNIEENRKNVEPAIEPELFRKYVAYAKKECKPVLTPEAKQRIQDFYAEIRTGAEDEDVIPATARNLEGAIRLSEAVARLQLSEIIELSHAELAIEITKRSMKDAGYDEESGEFDSDIIEVGESTSQQNRRDDLQEIVQMLCAQADDGLADHDKVVKNAQGWGHDKNKVERDVEKLLRQGELIDPGRDGHYRLA